MSSWRVISVEEGVQYDESEAIKGGICANDSYPYKGQTVPAPIKYDPKTGKFRVETKTFCSPNCAKRWIMNKGGSNMFYRLELLHLMCRKHLKNKSKIMPAPPTEVLERYTKGGWTIDQYRKHSAYQMPVEITTFPIIFNPSVSWIMTKNDKNRRVRTRNTSAKTGKGRTFLSQLISRNKVSR